jgi:hypothetical protein
MRKLVATLCDSTPIQPNLVLFLPLLKSGSDMNLFGVMILFALAPMLGLGQTPDNKTSHKEAPSDRSRSGLRGPVKVCVEETTYPAVKASDGRQFPERTMRIETVYDQEGRLVSTRNRNSDGSFWMVRNNYASGKPLKTTRGKEGEPPAVTTYAYDDQGRLKSITDSSAPENPRAFNTTSADAKRKCRDPEPRIYRTNVAFAGSPMQVPDNRPNLPGGGTATTTYDESDRRVEVLIRDAQGAEVSRTVSVYDEQGHVREEKQIRTTP